MKSSSITGLFDRIRNTHVHRLSLIGVGIGGLLMALFAIPGRLGIRVNTTESQPVGLYITTNDASVLVEFCPPEPAASIAAQRGYRGKGTCPDGATPLMKTVVAKEGDIVEFSGNGIVVNAQSIAKTVPLDFDTQGRPLRHFPFGRYRVEQGTLWVASSYNARSFDSRYFGPILESTVRAHLRPLLTF